MKIKVIHIITKLELGGAQQNTLFTLKKLDRNIFDPVLISGAGGILDEETKKIEGIKTYFIPELAREINPFKDLIAFFKLIKILSKEKQRRTMANQRFAPTNTEHRTPNSQPAPCPLPLAPQIIVHTHSSKAGILGRWAAKFAGIPNIIHTFHGFGFNDYQHFLKRSFFIFLERMTGKITSRFICVSKANIEKGERLGIFTEKKVSFIRSGIEIDKFSPHSCLSSNKVSKGDLEEFSEKIKERFKIKKNIPVVGMIACFKPQKAPLDFIKIAARVKEEVEAKFVLVGDGELRKEIEVEIERLNLQNDVILTGWQKDIPNILKLFDILILTSLWEGLPRVLPEAVASNIPVIATDVDGAREIIKNGVNGYLLAPHDINGFAEKIVYLLRNRAILASLSNGNKEILAEFDINDMVKKQEKLYMSLLDLYGTSSP